MAYIYIFHTIFCWESCLGCVSQWLYVVVLSKMCSVSTVFLKFFTKFQIFKTILELQMYYTGLFLILFLVFCFWLIYFIPKLTFASCFQRSVSSLLPNKGPNFLSFIHNSELLSPYSMFVCSVFVTLRLSSIIIFSRISLNFYLFLICCYMMKIICKFGF